MQAIAKSSGAEQNTIAADLWCPMNCKEEDQFRPGYMVEVLKEIYRRENIEVAYRVLPWSRAISKAERNEEGVVGIMGTTPAISPSFIFPKENLSLLEAKLYVLKKERWTYKKLEELISMKKSIGVIQDYTYNTDFDKFVRAHPKLFTVVADADPLSLLVKMLKNDRLDGFVEYEPIVLNKMAEDKKLKDLIHSTKVISNPPTAVYVAFAPKNPNAQRYAQIFDEGIRKLRREGMLKKILVKYSLSDWQH